MGVSTEPVEVALNCLRSTPRAFELRFDARRVLVHLIGLFLIAGPADRGKVFHRVEVERSCGSLSRSPGNDMVDLQLTKQLWRATPVALAAPCLGEGEQQESVVIAGGVRVPGVDWVHRRSAFGRRAPVTVRDLTSVCGSTQSIYLGAECHGPQSTKNPRVQSAVSITGLAS